LFVKATNDVSVNEASAAQINKSIKALLGRDRGNDSQTSLP
jgi:hypothetical protein